MGERSFRHGLRFLRFRRSTSSVSSSSSHPPPNLVNNEPRTPPIPAANRMSDASLAEEEENDYDSVIDIKSTHNELQDATCVICLDALAPGGSTVVLPGCGHSMWHAHCLRKWLSIAIRCPLCATSLEQYSSRALRSPSTSLALRSRRSTSYGLTTTAANTSTTTGSNNSRRLNPLTLPWSNIMSQSTNNLSRQTGGVYRYESDDDEESHVSGIPGQRTMDLNHGAQMLNTSNNNSRRINPLILPWSSLPQGRTDIYDDRDENGHSGIGMHNTDINSGVQAARERNRSRRRRSGIIRRRRGRRQSFNSMASSPQENEWVLMDRRISLVSRRRRRRVRLAQSLSMIWR